MKRADAPGAWREPLLRTGEFTALLGETHVDFAIADKRVLTLFPHVKRALKCPLVALPARETTKSLAVVNTLGTKALTVPRGGTVLALGGGTIGDVATVFAHLHKRGARLIHVPTTLLATVDSSLGGKGAVNVGSLKNALGVFHYPQEVWLCSGFFSTLKPAQLGEGLYEAWKMLATLDRSRSSEQIEMLRDPAWVIQRCRELKLEVCRVDPYDLKNKRVVLNFGHTFAHVVEALSGFRVPHGIAVGMGLACALDVGLKLGLTSRARWQHVERGLNAIAPVRESLRRVLQGHRFEQIRPLLEGDKKGPARMVLLEGNRGWTVREVPWAILRACVNDWQRGVLP